MRIICIVLLILTIGDIAQGQSFPSTKQESNPYALVAGGSKGIGFAVAEALAKRGFNLVLIARNIDDLKAAKEKLGSTYGIVVEVLSYDLSEETSAPAIARWCQQRNLRLKMLCNVAGLGGVDDYLSIPLDTVRYMVNLNVGSCMALTHTLLPLLKKNAPSYILNVGSLAGYAPIPDKNVYAATKSAVIFFSYALRYQLKEYDISVSCLNPGPVFTKPSIKANTKKQLGWIGMRMEVSPSRVGEIAVRKTLRGKLMITPGTLASIGATLVRTLPRRWVTAFYYKVGEANEQDGQNKPAARKTAE